ncbi:MAG: hypothetical protein EXR99_14070 [Gemmataceae bacterium]|nr:hypothetical protein [Gemmataceae bacterium]
MAEEKSPFTYNDPAPKKHDFKERSSKIDPRAMAHAEIEFVFEKAGKAVDWENASVDTRVAPRGMLVIWLMGYNSQLFDRLTGYGLHAIQVHYANGWFGKFGKESPGPDGKLLGKIRLEAATGEDFSDLVSIPKPDGMKERALKFVQWLGKKHPQGRWEYFLAPGGNDLNWERVIVAGSSHGSTTAARFAIHQKVGRVVMLCGPRDQLENWQGLKSATPVNRFFAFSHVLDGGWKGDHYPRSWQMLGLNQLGPLVNVDRMAAPYGNSRRLITDADVKGDEKKAHGAVTPGGSAVKDASGKYLHEPVWKYLFTHPVEQRLEAK